MRLGFFAGALLGSCACNALAQARGKDVNKGEDVVITKTWSDPAKCNRGVAAKVSLEALVRQPSIWDGKCISVRGYWRGQALFAVKSDAHRQYAQWSKEVGNLRIGIYGRDEVMDAAPEHPTAFTMVGVAGVCERLWAESMMVMGYCHYSGGPYIAVSQMRSR